jgi:hypothetical protein
VPGDELGQRVAAVFSVQAGLGQVRTQQCEQGALGLGEVSAGPRNRNNRRVRPGPGLAGIGGQGQHQLMIDPPQLSVALHAGAVPLPG